ncbi:integrase [Rhodopirellula rubra]|uniref:Integrase n=1 Tax=Aporhodopirellula rubra TaxID=980271 RepID=A0A7W5H9Y6_9BACT|nr:tyrosine-type recombinase/integrase [Aporhodopirellula rubra]MBB3210610.1 integrase [Aporhodopirellula rubra]
MASIVNRPNRHRWVQFVDTNGKRQTLRLGKVTKKNAEEVARRIEILMSAKISGDSIDGSTSAWIRSLEGKIRDRLAKLGLVEPRAKRKLLGEFLDTYIEERTDVSQGTLDTYIKARKNLIDHFGREHRLETITKADATKWRVYLKTESNARDKDRKWIADSTARRRTGKAKQFFNAAVEQGLIDANPFKHLPSTVHANEKRQHFVDRGIIDDCIKAAPDAEWRAIIAMARYGGFRMPSECTTLKWSNIDFAAGRMTIHAPKTKRHRSGGRRMCPLFPELRPYLEDLYELAQPGDEFVIPWVKRASNLRTRFEAIIELTGHEQWPKLFQNLRASRETELLGIYPAKDVSSWLGNSVPVAMKHYAMARKEIFEAAALKPTGTMPEGASPPAKKSEAETEADAKQNPKQQATAASGADEQEQKKSPRNAGSLQENAARLHSEPSGMMGDTELESVTSTMSTKHSPRASLDDRGS